MDQKTNDSLKNSAKPSKLLALTALVVAFALPFILVKSFPNKQLLTHNQRQHQLSKLEARLTPELVAPKIVVQQKTVSPPAKPATDAHQVAIAKTAGQAEIKPKPGTPAVVAISKPEPKSEWKIVRSRNRDSFAAVFSRLGLSPQILKTIIADNPRTRVLANLKPNQKLEFLLTGNQLEKLHIPLTTTQFLAIYREGQHYKTKINTRKITSHNQFVTATVQGSLYTTAKRHNIPYKLIQQMTDIFSGEINFAKEIRAGDQFTIIYKALYVDDKLIDSNDIVAVTYRNRGKVFQAVQHTNRSGRTDYYSPQGGSLRKAFNRYPLRFSHISSTFSLARNHPILRYTRPHKGVDLAAPIGTPILATGDGHIEVIGRQSGYGNMIKINHNKAFSTIYGHMLRFQKGLSRGSFVKRGQVIGYVGQTGLASGPHCHYEFHINHQPKNPTTVDLPRGDSVSGKELASFKMKSTTLLAQLKLFNEGRLANANRISRNKTA